ncbi:hypothetical protein Z042_10825 [Chania multitudinisentens RB-25]|uniref:TIGR04222 domain-containing membrane protein n=1 Tax=Chania multitudinisentens RB-25 TaxID=1441930 RepID=W0LFW3_9GAMM|nr:TIGR04222 domain-containing membrane protein [Chania multitudinisentens]AHG22753.1 hypothetical protein Z042_10825 [Chania multitudinisentens RB-25]
MTWTAYSNPLADMYGPWFLAFYLLYCLVLMWLVSLTLRRCLQSYSPSGSPSISLPAKIDPYYVAWLKGGIEHLLTLVMMRLSYKGLLIAGKHKGKTFMRSQSDNSEPANQKEQRLNRLEQLVLFRFEAENDQKKGPALSALRPLYQGFNAQAQLDGYTYPAAYQRASQCILWAGWVFMLSMGFYKLTIASLKGHQNVGFLIAMMLLFGWLYYAIFLRNRAGKAHLTPKGERFLSHLSTTLPKDKKSLKQLDIAMVAIALAGNNDTYYYSRCDLGRQAYTLGLLYPASAAAAAGSLAPGSYDSANHSSSDSDSTSGCSGCGGCGGGGD